MKLSKLLKLQLLYPITGILFNCASIYNMSIGGEQLTPTDPYGGLIAMSIFALFLLAGYFKWLKTYQLLMLIAILLLGYGGVVKNIFALISTPELYYSMGVGIFGMLINLYGLVLNIIAALGKFVVD